MGDLHGMVINDIGKVIRGETISLPDDEVLFRLCLPVSFIHKILNHSRSLGALKPHSVPVASCCTLFGLFRGDAEARAGISRWQSMFVRLLLMSLQVTGRAEASISLLFLDQAVRMSIIELQPLGLGLLVSTERRLSRNSRTYLPIWAKSPAYIRTCHSLSIVTSNEQKLSPHLHPRIARPISGHHTALSRHPQRVGSEFDVSLR